ncbi:tripartite tricarboxylate transporter permease [Ancylobacter terrae]|uniref:tripartite tricarboxylate transporter permease n=1 Tax=Ancylobacter sp. sgz301288 TaxID=3342077 RepID=UPI00385A0958
MGHSFLELLHGFSVALTPENLAWSAIGVTLGTLIGVLPGLGPGLTIALLLPLTYHVGVESIFILFGGIVFGAMYGGSTTSVLLNTPGEAGSIVTAIEGHQMARKGRGGPALATAAIGSFVAGTVGLLGITLLAPLLVQVALKIGPADYFALMLLTFVAITAVLGNSVVRGLVSLFAGFWLGLVGIDSQTGQMRLTFGSTELLDGIDVILVTVGLFAVGETLFIACRHHAGASIITPIRGSLWMSREDWSRSWKPWLRGSLIGFPMGALPAGGSEVPTFLSYALERRLSARPEEFGEGAIEGVAGPEAANNAAAAGMLVPMLTLGIPTTVTMAIMLSAFQSYGLNPGPLLFKSNPDLVWGLIASLYIGNVMLLVLNLPLIGLWVRVLKVPAHYLYPAILVFAMVGTYGISQSLLDLVLLVVLGLVGLAMRLFDFPTAPVVIGMILGPMAEQSFRRALILSHGDYSTFLTHPFSAVLLALAALLLALPLLARLRTRPARRAAVAPGMAAATEPRAPQ